MNNLVLDAAKVNEILRSIVDTLTNMQNKFQKAKATLNRQNRLILKHRNYIREH